MRGPTRTAYLPPPVEVSARLSNTNLRAVLQRSGSPDHRRLWQTNQAGVDAARMLFTSFCHAWPVCISWKPIGEEELDGLVLPVDTWSMVNPIGGGGPLWMLRGWTVAVDITGRAEFSSGPAMAACSRDDSAMRSCRAQFQTSVWRLAQQRPRIAMMGAPLD